MRHQSRVDRKLAYLHANPEPYADVPLLRKDVEWVEAQDQLPEVERKWDQLRWVTSAEYRQDMFGDASCGTAYCLAGHRAAADGYTVEGMEGALAGQVGDDGLPTFCDDYARDAYRIGQEAADILFDENNTATDIRAYAEAIARQPL